MDGVCLIAMKVRASRIKIRAALLVVPTLVAFLVASPGAAHESPHDNAVVQASAIEIIGPNSPENRPDAASDQIYVISTRGIGTRCEPDQMTSGLRCELYDAGAPYRWSPLSWEALAAELSRPAPTVIYVHGNRVDCGYCKSHGLAMYRSIASKRQDDEPLRFIIWSWPSSQIRGQIRDYQVKAARTKQVGWQLAWAIDQVPAETPLAIVGYSFGARVTTGALHLLGGGRLGSLELDRRHATRPPIRAALVAAALDASWIRPGGYHGRALEQVDRLLLVNNHLDPAMRFYHLAMETGARPLGFGGSGGLGPFASRVQAVDVTGAVGRHHAIEEYLASSRRVAQVLEQVAQFPQPLRDEERALASEESALPLPMEANQEISSAGDEVEQNVGG